ncbi:MAG: hypothetical protein Kapaf2KO_01160 [Candidatus Kapaibacteriales bacterium]
MYSSDNRLTGYTANIKHQQAYLAIYIQYDDIIMSKLIVDISNKTDAEKIIHFFKSNSIKYINIDDDVTEDILFGSILKDSEEQNYIDKDDFLEELDNRINN